MTKVYFAPNSQKLFNKIKERKIKTKIEIGISKLIINPYIGKKLEGEFEGQYSIRVWPYRIVYYISKEKNVIITDIGHRKEVYK